MRYSLHALLVVVATVAVGLTVTMSAGVEWQMTILAGLVLMWFGLALCGWGAVAFYRRRFLGTLAVLVGPFLAAAGLCLASLACSAALNRLLLEPP